MTSADIYFPQSVVCMAEHENVVRPSHTDGTKLKMAKLLENVRKVSRRCYEFCFLVCSSLLMLGYARH